MNESNAFQPLSEAQRLAYLQAMEVPLWIPRDLPEYEVELEIESENAQQIAMAPVESVAQKIDQSISEIKASAASDKMPTENFAGVNESKEVEAKHNNTTNTHKTNHAQSQIGETEQPVVHAVSQTTAQKKLVSGSYLKLISWRSTNKADKRLLIICRHHKDQPAQSFARSNGPSQFMSDYLKALQEYVAVSGAEIEMRLAHLTEAGLGSDCEPMTQKLTELKPDLVLVLGEEGVRHLFDKDATVSEQRGKLQQMEGGFEALVSYHPYSLISDPPLKRNALEDLRLVAKALLREEKLI
ncbi:hypothetical protein [Aliikangiella coralliicola]|uniref:Uracil-DNA glycosylase-like domain-containing protein n=1 Tax=Aliikangiella coralliicola TaxID=2592383 RepID=A0A545U0C3_9GAMM|nr:hypothetical protein [Aliikangiella coralliicola]TQV82916.1 hypothetical protein FLL46_24405 [Aliikangiella coralliicola]